LPSCGAATSSAWPVTDSNHPAGIDNPNRFFVFGVDAADVPAFQPQQLASRTCK